MTTPDKRRTALVLVGGGGHALVVAEAARLAGCDVVGFLDDGADAALGRGGEARGGAQHIGTLADLDRISDRSWILGLGDLALRAEVIERLNRIGARAAGPVVHPSAVVSPTAELGPGVYVGPRAVVHSRACIGAHAIINTGSIVEHECIIAPNAHIAPGAVLGGGVRVETGALVGLGARILPRRSVGTRSVVGAGAVVVRSIGEGDRVVGVPARNLRES